MKKRTGKNATIKLLPFQCVKPLVEIQTESPSVPKSRGEKSAAVFHNAEGVGGMH